MDVPLRYITSKVCAEIHTETHSVDGGERGTESEVHIFPHTRQTAGPADQSGGVGTAEGPGGASESIWPGEKPCGLSIADDICCRNGEVECCGKKQ